MIKILVEKQNGNIISFEVSGHSGYAQQGADIVCSAISTLTQTLAMGLEQVAKINCKTTITQNPAYLSVVLPTLKQADMQKAQLLMQTCLIGLKDIAKQYKKYVSIKEKNK